MVSLLVDDKMASRVGASILRAAGLEQLVCASHAAYEELAVQLAEDSDRLFEMRRHLENTRSNSAAFDTKRFVFSFYAINTLSTSRCISMLGVVSILS